MEQLHILFLPLMARGHTFPIIDMAKLFSSKGLKSTVITTVAYAELVRKAQQSGHDIGLILIKFPPPASRLPDHILSLDQLTSDKLVQEVFNSLPLLQEPVENIIRQLRPDCLVSDMFLPWTTDFAAKFGIPRLVFHGTSYFFLCASERMRHHKPFRSASSDDEPFLVPDLPHEIKFVRTQVPEYVVEEDGKCIFAELRPLIMEADRRSYGVVINSFYELEPDYANYYRKVLGRKAWNIGPLLLYNKREEEVKEPSANTIDTNECLSWLDSKDPESVVYVCFGSLGNFTQAQLHDLARGLEIAGHDFIWVVRKSKDNDQVDCCNYDDQDDCFPEGFVERANERGLIVRGWAPQVAILNHPAVGAFVTHCGWNSTLEGICAGVPMVTWPLFADQFYNEKLVTEVLRVGVSVGNKKWDQLRNEGVTAEAVAAAVEAAVEGELGVEMRGRGKSYKEMARKAVEGGSSCQELDCLIHELCVCAVSRREKIVNSVK